MNKHCLPVAIVLKRMAKKHYELKHCLVEVCHVMLIRSLPVAYMT